MTTLSGLLFGLFFSELDRLGAINIIRLDEDNGEKTCQDSFHRHFITVRDIFIKFCTKLKNQVDLGQYSQRRTELSKNSYYNSKKIANLISLFIKLS